VRLTEQFAVLDTMAANAKAAAISAKDDSNHRVEQTVSKNWKANETAWIYEHNVGASTHCSRLSVRHELK
jgi:hypothetical protein